MIRPAPLIAFLSAGAAACAPHPPPTPVAQASAPARLPVAAISSDQFESHPAFDPLTGDLYFVRSSPQFQGWRIWRSPCTASGLGPAEPAAFSGPGVEADPYFTADGGRLYFISSRPDPPAKTGTDLDIWLIERGRDGRWSAPARMPEPVNSAGEEWFPRLAGDGTLYFGSGRPGGHGETDIYAARREGGRWRVRNLGGEVSTAADDYEFEPARDGSFAVLMSGGALFRIRRSGATWARARRCSPARAGFTSARCCRRPAQPCCSRMPRRSVRARSSGWTWAAAARRGPCPVPRAAGPADARRGLHAAAAPAASRRSI